MVNEGRVVFKKRQVVLNFNLRYYYKRLKKLTSLYFVLFISYSLKHDFYDSKIFSIDAVLFSYIFYFRKNIRCFRKYWPDGFTFEHEKVFPHGLSLICYRQRYCYYKHKLIFVPMCWEKRN